MSHNYFPAEVPITADIKKIKAAVVSCCGDEWNGESKCLMSDIASGMGVKIINGCYTEKEAYDLAYGNDDFYWGGYIKAIPFTKAKKNRKINDLERRIKETRQKYDSYKAAHRVANHKAAFIGCPKCQSKIAKSYFEERIQRAGDYCPVCNTDLASETTKKTLNGYLEKIKALEKEIEAENKKNSTKPTHYFAICGIHD